MHKNLTWFWCDLHLRVFILIQKSFECIVYRKIKTPTIGKKNPWKWKGHIAAPNHKPLSLILVNGIRRVEKGMLNMSDIDLIREMKRNGKTITGIHKETWHDPKTIHKCMKDHNLNNPRFSAMFLWKVSLLSWILWSFWKNKLIKILNLIKNTGKSFTDVINQKPVFPLWITESTP